MKGFVKSCVIAVVVVLAFIIASIGVSVVMPILPYFGKVIVFSAVALVISVFWFIIIYKDYEDKGKSN